MTAEEFLRQGGTGEEYIPWIALRMEQYANAKVLEALEVVKTLTDNNVEVTSKHIESLIKSKTKI